MIRATETRWLQTELARVSTILSRSHCFYAELEQLELIELLTDADLGEDKRDVRANIGFYGIDQDGYRCDKWCEGTGERAHVPMAERLKAYLASQKEAA